jgi:Kef-type K+ transport system membrane component KefB
MNLKLLLDAIPLFLALLAFAVAAKIGGSYFGARPMLFPKDTSIAIGFLMKDRGMVELVITSIWFAAGIINITLFSLAIPIGFELRSWPPYSQALCSQGKGERCCLG